MNINGDQPLTDDEISQLAWEDHLLRTEGIDLAHPNTSLRVNCRACKPVLPMPPHVDFACLSHTCPDCGCPTDALYNAAGELVHSCCWTCKPSA